MEIFFGEKLINTNLFYIQKVYFDHIYYTSAAGMKRAGLRSCKCIHRDKPRCETKRLKTH